MGPFPWTCLEPLCLISRETEAQRRGIEAAGVLSEVQIQTVLLRLLLVSKDDDGKIARGPGCLHPGFTLTSFSKGPLYPSILACTHHSTPRTRSFSLEALELHWPVNGQAMNTPPLSTGKLPAQRVRDSKPGRPSWEGGSHSKRSRFLGVVGINSEVCPGLDFLFPLLLDFLMGNELFHSRQKRGGCVFSAICTSQFSA